MDDTPDWIWRLDETCEELRKERMMSEWKEDAFAASDAWERRFKDERRRQTQKEKEARDALAEVERAAREAMEAFKQEVAKGAVVKGADAEKLAELFMRYEAQKLQQQAEQEFLNPAPENPYPDPCIITMGAGAQLGIRAIGYGAGKPFIALITGRGGQFKWERKWVGQRTSRNRTLADGTIELIAGFGSLGTLPAALDIRWGPTGGGGLCVYRGFYKAWAQAPYLKTINEQEVAALVAARVETPPDRPVRASNRAPIEFNDEEVL